MRILNTLLAMLAAALLAGCVGWGGGHTGVKQTGSIVDYLYPDAKEAPAMAPTVTRLRPPVRVGIAFVPGSGWGAGLPEAAKLKLLERVRDAFSRHPYIGKIEIIPTQYMRPKGGYDNLEQVARLFDVEVVALLSYDQVQFTDANALSVLYWTIVGAYVVHGNQYDVQTMLDASVFDVKSRKLLFRAPGTSQVKGSASLSGLGERARDARTEGYNAAVDDLVPRLQAELDGFRERIRNDASLKVQVENREGYKGGGSLGWLSLALIALLGAVAYVNRRHPV